MSRVGIAVSDSAPQLCRDALAAAGLEPLRLNRFPPPDAIIQALGLCPILLHEFTAKDGETAVTDWFSELSAAAPGARVVAVLAKPAGGASRMLATAPGKVVRPILADVVVEGHVTTDRLESVLERLATNQGLHEVAAWICTRLAGDDPVLTEVVMTMIDDPAHHRTLKKTLADARIPRVEYVAAARNAGYQPPRLFHRAVRMFLAHTLLRGGLSVPECAVALGLRKEETLYRTFKDTAGVTPGDARALSRDDLFARLQQAS